MGGLRLSSPDMTASPVVSGMRSGGQVAPALGRFATVVPDEAWTELDAC